MALCTSAHYTVAITTPRVVTITAEFDPTGCTLAGSDDDLVDAYFFQSSGMELPNNHAKTTAIVIGTGGRQTEYGPADGSGPITSPIIGFTTIFRITVPLQGPSTEDSSHDVTENQPTTLALVMYAGDYDSDLTGSSGNGALQVVSLNGTPPPLTVTITSPPAHGTLDPITLLYTPDTDFHGTDSFSFTINDGTDDSNESTCSITVIPTEVLLSDGEPGLTWVEFTDSNNELHVWSDIALADPITYYGGFKDARITEWGLIHRALSDEEGQYESQDFTFTASDADRFIRGLLAGPTTRYFPNRSIVVRSIMDAQRRALDVPRTILRGFVSDYKPAKNLLFDFSVRDALGAQFGLQNTDNVIPQRTITLEDFPDASGTALDQNGQTRNIAAAGLPVPFIYGEITDTKLVPHTGIVTGLPPVDPTLPAPVNYGGIGRGGDLRTALNPSGRRWVAIAGYVTATGKRSPLSDVSGNIARDSDFQNASGVGVNFVGNPMFDGYFVIASDAPDFNIDIPSAGSGHYLVYMTHDNVTLDGEVPGAQFEQVIPAWSGVGIVDILTLTSTPTTTLVDAGKGQCPSIYVGIKNINGTDYHGFLLAGHACQSIGEIYVNDLPVGIQNGLGVDDGTFTGLSVDGAHVPPDATWLVPGFARWQDQFGALNGGGHPNKVETINARDYTIVYGKVGQVGPDTGAGILPPVDGCVPLAFSVAGIDDVGDGSGALIVDLPLQYRHALQNWVLGNYQGGDWLDSPTFPDDPTLAMVDDDSFDVANTLANVRVPGGYRGDFITGFSALGLSGQLGGISERIAVRDFCARFNLSGDVNSGFNRNGQFFISMVDDSAFSVLGATTLTDVREIIKDSFDIFDDIPHQYNVVPYRHTRDYFNREPDGWRSVETGVTELADELSITYYSPPGVRIRLTAPTFFLQMVRGQNRDDDADAYAQGTLTARDVVGRYLIRHKDPPRLVSLQVGMPGYNLELGQVIRLTHFGGIGPSGWTNRPLRILRHEGHPGQYTVDLQLFDMQELFDTAFILGDEAALASDWTAAPAADRAYGYLADETTGLFSAGESGKRLR